MSKKEPFENFDFSNFWNENDYYIKNYTSEPPTDELIEEIEKELGYKLPESYIWLMKKNNGGAPVDDCHPTKSNTSWAEDHVAITGILGIGKEKENSLGGYFGSAFWIEDWDYPDIGVAICDCPSGGHDMIFLDYRESGSDGEPSVVHVDQGLDYEITFLADNFESFIRGLVNDDVYDTFEEDKKEYLEIVKNGKFSPLLTKLCSNVDVSINIENKIREISKQIVESTGHFSLYSNELLYDIQFWLFTNTYENVTEEEYFEKYDKIIAMTKGFSTKGYSPAFVKEWLDTRIKEGKIIKNINGLSMTKKAESDLINQLENIN